ncbi:MAG: O-antigen ligase family protein [Flavobacteriales bacterium]|nr:O-antigen ligase family protein [Bacteroidota bacterium]MCB9240487.1 O-antigen ligase family protein [Flavobacteriales bacterium]
MPVRADLKWFYGLGFAFLALNLICFAFDFYFSILLPFVPVILYVMLVRTDLLLYILAFATPLSIPFKDIGGGIGLIVPTEPLILFLFLGFGFKLMKGQQLNMKVLKNPIVLVVMLNVLWLIITSFTSVRPLISAKYTLSYIWYVFVFLIVLAHFFQKERRIRIFLWCFSIATTILVAYTLKNHAAESFTRLYAYTAMRPFLPDHGMYAAAISFVIPVMMVFALFGLKSNFNGFAVSMATFVFIFVTLGVIFSFTRASWLSLVVAIGVFFLLMFKVQFRSIVMIGLVGIGAVLLFQNTILMELGRNKQDSDDDIEEHLQSFSNVSTDPSNLERLNRWSSASRMFQDKPIVGFGPGTYTFEYGPYQLSSEMTIISTNAGDLGNVHSEYLRPFAESGVLGGLLFLALVIITLREGFALFYAADSNHIRILVLGCLLGLITYFAHGLLNNYSEFDKIAVPMWGFMAVLVAVRAFHLPVKTD